MLLLLCPSMATLPVCLRISSSSLSLQPLSSYSFVSAPVPLRFFFSFSAFRWQLFFDKMSDRSGEENSPRLVCFGHGGFCFKNPYGEGRFFLSKRVAEAIGAAIRSRKFPAEIALAAVLQGWLRLGLRGNDSHFPVPSDSADPVCLDSVWDSLVLSDSSVDLEELERAPCTESSKKIQFARMPYDLVFCESQNLMGLYGRSTRMPL
mmetsp:Transcript_45923/g.90475  ORF Transcript_45923/g.90475 Transcript_45923/m.90475 type:complete len:206 (+) Transcript_45923:2-619(+)